MLISYRLIKEWNKGVKKPMDENMQNWLLDYTFHTSIK